MLDAPFGHDIVKIPLPPFGGPRQVVEYLGRYTHKIAISNYRLQAIGEGKVRFGYKDYRPQGRKRSMELTQQEFIRRFSQHILPKAFVRIRHYGFLSSTAKGKRLPELRRNLQVSAPAAAAQTLHRRCPCCKKGSKLITLKNIHGRGQPT